MELQDALKNRKSIRKFKPDPVPEEMLTELVQAGCEAATASNLQAWHFFVVNDPTLSGKIGLVSPGLSGNPPVIIAIASDLRIVEKRGSENSLEYGCMMDAAMACENIMLRAVDLGLGTCAIKSYSGPAVRKLLKLPAYFRLELLVTVGWPDADPVKPKRKDLSEVMTMNAWKEET